MQRVKYVQDQKEQMRIVTCCHSDITSGHLGIAKTVARIKERYTYVERYYSGCERFGHAVN